MHDLLWSVILIMQLAVIPCCGQSIKPILASMELISFYGLENTCSTDSAHSKLLITSNLANTKNEIWLTNISIILNDSMLKQPLEFILTSNSQMYCTAQSIEGDEIILCVFASDTIKLNDSLIIAVNKEVNYIIRLNYISLDLKTLLVSDNCLISDITSSSRNTYYITGSFKNTTKILGVSLTSLGQQDVFIAELSNDSILWIHHLGTPSADISMQMIYSSDLIYLAVNHNVNRGALASNNLECPYCAIYIFDSNGQQVDYLEYIKVGAIRNEIISIEVDDSSSLHLLRNETLLGNKSVDYYHYISPAQGQEVSIAFKMANAKNLVLADGLIPYILTEKKAISIYSKRYLKRFEIVSISNRPIPKAVRCKSNLLLKDLNMVYVFNQIYINYY